MDIYITIFILILGLINPYCNKWELIQEILADIIIELSGTPNIQEYYGQIEINDFSNGFIMEIYKYESR